MGENPVFPMNEYRMNNIRTTLVLNSGAKLEGLVKMYAKEMLQDYKYSFTRFCYIGSGSEGVIAVNSGSVNRTWNSSNSDVTYTFNGNTVFQGEAIEIAGTSINTKNFHFAIPQGSHIVLNGSHSYSMANSYKFLYGSSMTIGSNTTLTIPSGVSLVMYSKTYDATTGPFLGSVYDSDDTDTSKGPAKNGATGTKPFDESNYKPYAGGSTEAYLKLENGATLTGEGSFAGRIQAPLDRDEITVSIANLTASTYEAYWWYNAAFDKALWRAEYKFGRVWQYADYSKVYDALEKVPADLSKFSNTGDLTTAVTNANNSIANPLTDADANQATVDGLAQDILDAINALAYTVTLVYGNGSENGEITLTYGAETYGELPAPTQAGYTFGGWHTDEECTEGNEAGTPMPGSHTLYAKWTINQYRLQFDTAGGAVNGPITQDYLTQVDALPDAVRAGYRFDGWFYADRTAVTLPITLEDDITVVARWTSYLDLLMEIKPETFDNAEADTAEREVLEQARVYFNLMKVDSAQLTKYQGNEEPYASHWDALEAEIREVILLELEASIEGQEMLGKVNDLLTDNGKAAATLNADPVTNYVEIWLEEPDRKAADFLTIQFLTTLLSNENIWSIHFPVLSGQENSGVPLTPYGEGVQSLQQLDLMILVAFATINTPEITGRETEMSYREFFTWLRQNQDITVGVLDGKSVKIAVNAKTPEGVEFSTPYVLSFRNRAHDVTWDVDGVVSSRSYNYNDPVTKPADPAKEGYTFAGWEGYTDGMTMGKENVTFKAIWTINSYDVTWNVDGDTTVVPYEYGALIQLPEEPSKEGHSFTGWFGYTDGMTMPDENLTFHAVWDALEFTVIFDSDGGTVVGSVTQDYGTQVSAPAVPEKTGCTFGGWYNGDTKVEFPLTMPAGGLNLKAKWLANQYAVTLDASGGSVEQETVTVTYGQPYGLPTPSREGYTFDGWFHNGTLVSANVDITADATFVDQWTLGNPYNISYDLDDGQWAEGTSLRVQYTVETDSFTLPTPTREGYTFAGWTGTDRPQPTREVTVLKGSIGNRSYTAKWTVNQYTITFVQGNGEADIVLNQDYGTGVTAPADPVREGYTFGGWDQTVPDTMLAGDMTIHALWEINAYTITFETAGGTAVNPVQDVYGAPINAPADPTREGYTFDGWNVEIPGTMPAGNMTITARWKVNTYTLTCLVDGVVYKTLRMNYGAVVAPEAAPTKTGYTFSGWDKTVMQMPAGDVQISGTFSANSYTVHFNANYSTAPSVADVTVVFDSAYGILSVVSRTGYTFSGWTLDGEAVTEDTVVRTAGDHTLVAQWTPNTYKVTLILAGGESNVTEITVVYDGTYAELPVPVREGYDFLGWFDGETQVLSSNKVTITADQTLTARWTLLHADYTAVDAALDQVPTDMTIYTDDTAAAVQTAVNGVVRGLMRDRQAEVNAMAQAILDAVAGLVKRTVTVKTDNGSTEKKVVYGEPVGTLPEPEDDCKIFLGWYNEAGERVTEDTVISSLDDLMLTAKWQDVCLETDGNHYSMMVHYHGTAGEITSVDVTVENTVGVDAMTLRIPVTLPTTKDAARAPLIHVQVPDGFKLRLEIPMDTQHYGNVAVIDPGTAAQSGTAEMTIINETVVTDDGVALAVTGSMDIRVVENSRSFPDVPDGFWSKNEVDYLTARKFILGKYDGTYAPTEAIMRKTVVMLLWRFAGSPDPSSMISPFPDVQNPNDIYYKPILWAYENGITRGYTDGTFGGDDVILRQHFAAMVHRYASKFEYELPAHDNGDLENFADYALIGESFHQDVQWALDCGLILGHRDGRYNPQGETRRDQMSVVFFRFLQAYHKAMYEADPEQNIPWASPSCFGRTGLLYCQGK